MPRVLLVHPFAQPISGPDQSILAVMGHLVGAGWEYDVVLPGESPFRAQYEALGCRVFVYPMSIIKRRLDPRFVAGYVWRFLPTVRFLLRLIREVRPDIVHTNGAVILGGGLAAWWAGVPSVYHIRCSQIAHPRLVAGIVARVIGWTSQRVIAISESCAAPLAERGFAGKTVLIHNGVALDAYGPPGGVRHRVLGAAYGLPPETPLVGQVGRLAPIKGFDRFVEVCAAVHETLPEVHFFAVGAPYLPSEKAYEEAVRGQVASAGLDGVFHFTGHRTDIPAIMSSLDVFVTMAREEGFGRVAVEAMAAGCPVVANRVDGLVEVVRDGETGYLVGPDDPAATAQRVVKLLQDRLARERMSAAAAADARERFSAAACAQRTAEVYRQVLGRD